MIRARSGSAVHESGHAVVLRALAGPNSIFEIQIALWRNGHVTATAAAWLRLDPDSKATYSLAGSVAAGLGLGKIWNSHALGGRTALVPSDSDLVDVAGWAPARIEKAKAWAAGILEDHWDALVLLADFLDAKAWAAPSGRAVVPGDEVEAALRAVEARRR
jgi:hypothetical protein